MDLRYFCGIGAELKRQRIDFDYMNQIYLYVLHGTETLNQVTTANFFNDVAVSLQPNDVIFIYSGANSLYTPYKVTKDADNNVTLSEVLNNSLKALIDSMPETIGNLLSDGTIPMDALYTPTDDQDIATKKYVDDNAGLGNLLSDGTVPMDTLYTPTDDQDIATKKYADDTVSTAIGALGDLASLDTVDSAQIDTGAVGSDELNKEAITGQTTATLATDDLLVFSDTNDSGNLKKTAPSTVDIAIMGSGSATVGQVPQADGSGGVDWATPASGGGYTATTTISATSDWDTLTTAGLYKTSGTTYVNAPLFSLDTTGFLAIKRIDGDANRIVQEWYDGAKGNTWQRITSNGGTSWTMWKVIVFNTYKDNYVVKFDGELVDVSTPLTSGLGVSSGLQVIFSGTGAKVDFDTIVLGGTGVFGFSMDGATLRMQTGTAATGAAQISNARRIVTENNTFHRYETSICLDSNASNGTNTYYVLFGTPTRDTANKIFFSYTHGENSGNWVCVTDNGGTETVTNTAVAPARGDGGSYSTNQQKLRIELESVSKVRFFIDDVLVATHTTNIVVSGIALEDYGVIKILKSAGSANRYLNVASSYFHDFK